jgi:hypothetical protein
MSDPAFIISSKSFLSHVVSKFSTADDFFGMNVFLILDCNATNSS